LCCIPLLAAIISFIHEAFWAKYQRLQQLEKQAIEMNSAIKEICEEHEVSVEPIVGSNITTTADASHAVATTRIQQIKQKLEQLEKLVAETNALDKSKETTKNNKLMEVSQLIHSADEDLESEELSNNSIMTTIAEVHSCAENNNRSPNKFLSRKQQSCTFSDSVEDITMIE